MTFIEIFPLLLTGKCFRRQAWPEWHRRIEFEKGWIWLIQRDDEDTDTWDPSQEDILATDWEIVPPATGE